MDFLLLAQETTGDPEALADSGIADVSTGEWVLAVVLFLGSIALSIVVRRVVSNLISRTGTAGVAHLGGRAAAFFVVLLGFFYALSSVDVAVGPLVGGLGVAGIAVAFALQSILGNFAAGVMLHLRRPISIGDQIVSNEFEGEVQDVNFRSTRLRTFDGETVYIPNAMVLENPIINWTKTPTRRTTLVVGVAYDTDLGEAQRVFTDAVTGVEGVEDYPEVEAFVEEFGESSINFAVRFWHGATIIEMWRARDDAAQAIKRGLDEAGITIPFPQRTLWFGPGNTQLDVRTQEAANGGALGPGAASRPPGRA